MRAPARADYDLSRYKHWKEPMYRFGERLPISTQTD